MTLIIGATLIILIIFVYKYSIPGPEDRIGPPVQDTASVVLDTASHSVTIEK